MSDSVLFSLTPEERENAANAIWEECRARVAECTRCALCRSRHLAVFGEGARSTPLMFIGEGPGEDEDMQGRPFVGRAGQLLTQILQAAGMQRDDVYITNVVKCRPPGNRTPAPEEMLACDNYLQTQILLIKPAIIVLLGNTPMKWMLKTAEGITKLRGRWIKWRGAAVMPMFHPSYLLRSTEGNREGSPKHLSWIDIQEVKKQLDAYHATGRLDGITYG